MSEGTRQYTKQELEAHYASMPHGPGRVPSTGQLIKYLLHAVKPEQEIAIHDHLERCPKCKLLAGAAARSFSGLGKRY